ncbi:MAG: sigma-54-dependent Fis family transcriptional regulator [Burkholderiales bacterium]|nr:sigma-54-dependent Fis family transcriptional regulator [Burkholderiales bacterium]
MQPTRLDETTARRAIASPRIRGFAYCSQAAAKVAERLVAIAGCDAHVLIQGETGTGKEVCAQAVHYLSARASHPCVAVNCGGIPADLVEDELFGHVRGAYTTALVARRGLVREAEGGTLFLDDVDCLPLAAQAKLLRFLQELEYRPVGANAVMHADVRVIAASNRDLHALALSGAFRQDLYFRLNVLRLSLPPLRQRREDTVLLAEQFLREFALRFERPARRFSAGAIQRLLAHGWPGNVRELRHLIERAVLLAPGVELQSADLEFEGDDAPPPAVDGESFHGAKQRVVRDFERGYIEQLLDASGGNIAEAARAAKKDRRAFFELMRKHRIDAGRFRDPRQA